MFKWSQERDRECVEAQKALDRLKVAEDELKRQELAAPPKAAPPPTAGDATGDAKGDATGDATSDATSDATPMPDVAGDEGSDEDGLATDSNGMEFFDPLAVFLIRSHKLPEKRRHYLCRIEFDENSDTQRCVSLRSGVCDDCASAGGHYRNNTCGQRAFGFSTHPALNAAADVTPVNGASIRRPGAPLAATAWEQGSLSYDGSVESLLFTAGSESTAVGACHAIKVGESEC